MTDAKEYGKALFLLAEESGRTEKILCDLDVLRSALDGNPDYAKLLDTPAIEREERVSLAHKAFSTLDEYVLNTVKILCERHLTHLFPKVSDAFRSEYDRARGIERVVAVTAVKMTDSQLSAMKAKLEAMTEKTVVITNTVDPSILGGVQLRYMGKQLDGSLKTRLEVFNKALSNIVM